MHGPNTASSTPGSKNGWGEEDAPACPAVAALPGAQSGRMDLSRDGPRFGHRKPDPESPKKWAAKLAAKKAARHRAFLVHLGQHPIH